MSERRRILGGVGIPIESIAQDVVDDAVARGQAPGLVGLIDGPEGRAVVTAGVMEPGRPDPMRADAVFRLASLTKPVMAALVMTLIDAGLVALDDPVERWLPELAKPTVLRTPTGPLDDVMAARRPILVEDLLTFRAGYGFPADFSLPWVERLLELSGGGPAPRLETDADHWIEALATLPLLHQPGEGWLYNTCSDIQGVLVSRVLDRPIDDALAERLLEPLGMVDTGFHVPTADAHRVPSSVEVDADGVRVRESGAGTWTRPARFASGSGGLVATVSDWAAFAAMLLAGGRDPDGRRVLSQRSATAMTTDHTTRDQRASAEVFLDGQGWGYGGSVDIAPIDSWNVPGRYGWMGGSGTAGYIVPSTGMSILLFGQVVFTGPGTPDYMGRFLDLAVPRPNPPVGAPPGDQPTLTP